MSLQWQEMPRRHCVTHFEVMPESIIHQLLLKSRRFINVINKKATVYLNRRAPKMPAKWSGPFYAHLTAKDSKQSPIQYKHLRFVFIIYSSTNKGPALHIVLFSRIVWSMEAALQQAAAIRPQKRICNPFTFRTRVAIWQKPFLPTPFSTCMAGKWISIYGSISLIIAHSFLSGPESTLAAEH